MSERGSDTAEPELPPSEAESAAAALAALEEPKPRRRLTWRWLLLIVLTLVVLAAAGLPFIRPAWRAIVQGGSTSAIPDPVATRLAGIEQQLSGLERRLQGQSAAGDISNRVSAIGDSVDALQQQVARVEQETEGVSDFDTRIARLEQQQGELEKAVHEVQQHPPGAVDPEVKAAVDAHGKAIADLEGQMAALRDTARTLSHDARSVAIVTALDEVGEAAERSGAFAPELKAVLDLAAQDPALASDAALAALKGRAQTGVPTLPDLQAEFARLAGSIVSAGEAPADSDWGSRTLARVESWVSIRRTGDIPGQTPEAIVARTERHLAAGDLAAAAHEIEQLSGQAATTAAPWLEGAHATLSVETAVEQLRTQALASLGSAPPAAAATKAAP